MPDDSVESPNAQGGRWLLLIHQLPPHPAYLRVKVRRRLARLGAIALKNTVYALPWSDEAIEDFQWLRREIEAEGGEAVLWEGAPLDGRAVEAIGSRHAASSAAAARSRRDGLPNLSGGRVWVTRRDVHVDRIASAWLIRRFIDLKARFKFVSAKGYHPAANELRFDMFEAEFTHEGDRCTFETLLHRFGIRDRALKILAEMVHDIDCKDDKFGRPETAGVRRLIHGVTLSANKDERRLELGAAVLDSLYSAYHQP